PSWPPTIASCFISCRGRPRALHSFPTRRSSDLASTTSWRSCPATCPSSPGTGSPSRSARSRPGTRPSACRAASWRCSAGRRPARAGRRGRWAGPCATTSAASTRSRRPSRSRTARSSRPTTSRRPPSTCASRPACGRRPWKEPRDPPAGRRAGGARRRLDRRARHEQGGEPPAYGPPRARGEHLERARGAWSRLGLRAGAEREGRAPRGGGLWAWGERPVSVLASLARLEAVAAGVARPLATVRHCHVADAPLVLVPLRLAGEAAAPLAVMAGSAPGDPELLVVPQPRNRDLRFAFAADLAKLVLKHIETSRGEVEVLPPGKEGEERIRYGDAPQLLVPN